MFRSREKKQQHIFNCAFLWKKKNQIPRTHYFNRLVKIFESQQSIYLYFEIQQSIYLYSKNSPLIDDNEWINDQGSIRCQPD